MDAHVKSPDLWWTAFHFCPIACGDCIPAHQYLKLLPEGGVLPTPLKVRLHFVTYLDQ